MDRPKKLVVQTESKWKSVFFLFCNVCVTALFLFLRSRIQLRYHNSWADVVGRIYGTQQELELFDGEAVDQIRDIWC